MFLLLLICIFFAYILFLVKEMYFKNLTKEREIEGENKLNLKLEKKGNDKD